MRLSFLLSAVSKTLDGSEDVGTCNGFHCPCLFSIGATFHVVYLRRVGGTIRACPPAVYETPDLPSLLPEYELRTVYNAPKILSPLSNRSLDLDHAKKRVQSEMSS